MKGDDIKFDIAGEEHGTLARGLKDSGYPRESSHRGEPPGSSKYSTEIYLINIDAPIYQRFVNAKAKRDAKATSAIATIILISYFNRSSIPFPSHFWL